MARLGEHAKRCVKTLPKTEQVDSLEYRELEMERHRDAVEDLLLHQDLQFTCDHGTVGLHIHAVFRNAESSNLFLKMFWNACNV